MLIAINTGPTFDLGHKTDTPYFDVVGLQYTVVDPEKAEGVQIPLLLQPSLPLYIRVQLRENTILFRKLFILIAKIYM